ncbi:Fic family protein [Bdellovibrionota bacterium FG-2]
MRYIYERKNWPEFHWHESHLAERVANLRHQQGRLVGRMEGLGLKFRTEAALQNLTEDVLKSSEIEGERLDRDQVRSSLARRLGVDVGGLIASDRNVEGVVEMMLDATQQFKSSLTNQRLFRWHKALFPAAHSGMTRIRVGRWRDDRAGPMQVVSGAIGRNRIHYQAPEAGRLPDEVRAFLSWFNGQKSIDPVLKAGVAHLWFVTLHPFDDGNGRIARAIADMSLARSENSPQRFYSMSAQICSERTYYYDVLEATQKGSLDITDWLEWFLSCLGRAFQGSEAIMASVLKKAQFWERWSGEMFNDRQRKIINRLLDGFDSKLTSSKWAALGNCSQDSASRDIDDLVKRNILIKNSGGGRSTSYSLIPMAAG